MGVSAKSSLNTQVKLQISEKTAFLSWSLVARLPSDQKTSCNASGWQIFQAGSAAAQILHLLFPQAAWRSECSDAGGSERRRSCTCCFPQGQLRWASSRCSCCCLQGQLEWGQQLLLLLLLAEEWKWAALHNLVSKPGRAGSWRARACCCWSAASWQPPCFGAWKSCWLASTG